jgi:hypothetical protein
MAAGSDQIYPTKPKSAESDSRFRDNLEVLNDSSWGKSSHPIYIYEGLWSIEDNPNQNKKHFSFYLLSFHTFISLPYFFNTNLGSSLVSAVIEGVLASLLMLGQANTCSS